jgi:hypothetical protein
MPAYRTVFCTEFLHFFFSTRTPDIVGVDLNGASIGLLREGFMNPCATNSWLEYVGSIEL